MFNFFLSLTKDKNEAEFPFNAQACVRDKSFKIRTDFAFEYNSQREFIFVTVIINCFYYVD